jgi:hypothetical protein
MTDKVRVTKHAEDRGKERFSLSTSSIERMLDTILEKGVTHSDATGRLKKYFDYLYLTHKPIGSTIRIYGEIVYIIRDNTLVTMFPLPQTYKNCCNKIRRRKEDDRATVPVSD